MKQMHSIHYFQKEIRQAKNKDAVRQAVLDYAIERNLLANAPPGLEIDTVTKIYDAFGRKEESLRWQSIKMLAE